MKYCLSLLLAGWALLSHAADAFETELLPAEQAFALEAGIIEGDRIRAAWTIADGYYLYRDKFRFSTAQEGIRLGDPVIPPGKRTQDEFFGEIETYRHQVIIEIPVSGAPGAPADFELRVTSQGCADIGVCYPPHTQVVALSLPERPAQAAPGGGGALQALRDLGSNLGFGGGDELLPEDQAFGLDVAVAGPQQLTADWNIADGYYLYRHTFGFEVPADSGVRLLPAELAPGKKKHDEFFGDIEVYHRQVRAMLPFERDNAAAIPLKLTVKYQGCAEIGVCYPPITRVVDVLIPPADAAGLAAATTAGPPAELSEQDALARRLLEGNLLMALAVFFGSGLLLAFTPCVFPMIPILSSIIVGQGKDMTAARASRCRWCTCWRWP
jgi:thioredoxin:protein disulfide reductase